MTNQAKKLGKLPLILSVFLIINIIGEVGNIIAWWAVPSMQISLNGGTLNGVISPASILSNEAGPQSALIIGSAILLVVAVGYIYSLWGLRNRKPSAPITIIGISIVNRLLTLVIFAISAAFIFWAVWTVILVVVSFMVWRKLKA